MTRNTHDTKPRTRRSVLRGAAAGLAATVTTTLGLSGSATAETSDSGAFFSGGEPISSDQIETDWLAYAKGVFASSAASYKFWEGYVGEKTDATRAAYDAVDAFNAVSDDIRTYANDRGYGSADNEVLEVTFEVDDESETAYLVTEYDDAEGYTAAEAVTETDRDVDLDATLSGPPAKNAAEEIELAHEGFIADNEAITENPDYLSNLMGRYSDDYLSGDGPHIGGTLFDEVSV